MVTHYKVVLRDNIIGRLLSEIRSPYYSWDLDNQRSQIEPGKSGVQAPLILADVKLSGLPTCPNNLQSGMSDFHNIAEFRASA